MRGQYANKRDRNEAEIVAILRAHGFTVALMDTPVDLLIGRSGKTYIAEVKDGPKAKYTKAQREFLGLWRGQFVRFDSVESVEAWARAQRGNRNG